MPYPFHSARSKRLVSLGASHESQQNNQTRDEAKGRQEDGTLLFLITIVLGDFRLEKHAIGLIFGFDEYSVFILRSSEKGQ